MRKHALTVVALCGSAVLHGFAQEVPPAPPVAPAPPVPATPPVPPGPANHHPSHVFLGVEVRPLSPALSEQLNLPEGFGVLVEYVVPGSAAEAAGIKANDILKSLDGQIVTSAEHLAVLVRSFTEGQDVSLVVVHKGQETKLTAKLQKRTGRDADQDRPDGRRTGGDSVADDYRFDFDGSSPDYQRQLRAALERSRAEIDAATRRATDESRRALDKVREQTNRAFDSRTDYGPARVVLRDPTGRIELRVVRGKRTLRVRDEKGETLFEGPINTPEQRQAIPANVRPQVEALEREQETVFPKGSYDEDDD